MERVEQLCYSEEEDPELCRLGSPCNSSMQAIFRNCTERDYWESPHTNRLEPVPQTEWAYRYMCGPCMLTANQVGKVPRCSTAYDDGYACDKDCYPWFVWTLGNCTGPPLNMTAGEWETVKAEASQTLAACPSYDQLTTFTTTSTRTRRCVQISEDKARRLHAAQCGGYSYVN